MTEVQLVFSGIRTEFTDVIYMKIMFQERDVAKEPVSRHKDPGSIPYYLGIEICFHSEGLHLTFRNIASHI